MCVSDLVKNGRLIFSSWLLWSCASHSVFVDSRDGNQYSTVVIDQKKWFAENLRYKDVVGYPYDRNAVNIANHGILYPYTSIDQVCPNGWRTASDRDWQEMLAMFSTDHDVNEFGNLRHNVNGNLFEGGKSGLNVKLSGYFSDDKFSFMDKGTLFWAPSNLSDSVSSWYFHDSTLYDTYAYQEKMNKEKATTRAYYIRCVKDIK